MSHSIEDAAALGAERRACFLTQRRGLVPEVGTTRQLGVARGSNGLCAGSLMKGRDCDHVEYTNEGVEGCFGSHTASGVSTAIMPPP